MYSEIIAPVRHGLILAVTAMIAGALWAGFLATQHERLHGHFSEQEAVAEASRMQHLMEDLATTEPDHMHAPGTPAGHHHDSPREDDATHAAEAMHSHSGSLATDAMQRLLRGHIHFMGLGALVAALLLVLAFTSLRRGWKVLVAWAAGIGMIAYPPAWIVMGFRTVELGPQAAEASIMWLFGPAVALLLAAMAAVLAVLLLEQLGWQKQPLFERFFDLPG